MLFIAMGEATGERAGGKRSLSFPSRLVIEKRSRDNSFWSSKAERKSKAEAREERLIEFDDADADAVREFTAKRRAVESVKREREREKRPPSPLRPALAIQSADSS